MFNKIKNIGPGALIAAAFIGPGTVTVCTLAGVNFGLSLLWVMLLAVFFTIFLQEMAARIGVITQNDLAFLINQIIPNPLIKKAVIFLILLAILVGNAAYESGNITGASLGFSAITTSVSYNYIVLLIGGIAALLLFIGNYKIIERSLIFMVIIMSISFVITAFLTKPSITEIVKGTFFINAPKGSLLTIIGLIGTTVVPYNIFLHTSLAKEKWKSSSDLAKVRFDTIFSVLLGGFVSMSIIIAASSVQNSTISTISDLSQSLEPLYGNFASYFLGIGMFSAGITSAITAPLAAAYVAKGCFGWQGSLKDFKFRLVWVIVLSIGIFFSLLNFKPIDIIKFAQIANGLLLPLIAIVLLYVVNNTTLLRKYTNSKTQNIIGLLVVIITILLGLRSILKVFDLL